MLRSEATLSGSQHQLSLLGGLIAESTSLFLLWFVLSGQGRSWKAIGWNWQGRDPMRAVSLVVVVMVAGHFATMLFQAFYHNATGHYLTPRTTHGIIGTGISALSVIFVVINPVFEEMIVRAYTMTETIALTGSPVLAIVISVVVQMSYHVYQGLVRCIALTITFLVFSIYFALRRRIVPVVLAHFCLDAIALASLR